jgi:SAM-dependent methyltransferase
MSTVTPYDEILYPGYPFPQTHPDRLAVLAALFGMKAASVESCRVLELGCGDGANLIPMALTLPDSKFVGIDLAARPIKKGVAVVEALGLPNIDLRAQNLLDVTGDLGQFDYIIAHGVYSWVPPVVQNKLLQICKMNLAAQGVAYVSYNTYPGGHLRQMLREMMLFHIRGADNPQEKIDQARALVSFLREAQPKTDEYALLLKRELELTLARTDGGMYHDDLASINAPVYFYQFIEHAAACGLQYLAEADPLEMGSRDVFPLADEMFRQSGIGLLGQEQYLDFLKCRRFRQTLLCSDDVVLQRPAVSAATRHFYLASSARPLSTEPNIASSATIEKFQAASGVVMSASDPLVKAALVCLREIWPQAICYDDLVRDAWRRLGEAPDQHDEADQEKGRLCEMLLAGFESEVVDLHLHQPRFVSVPSERPVVSDLARLQAREGHALTTARHTIVDVNDDLARQLIMLLDGTRDRHSLVAELIAAMGSQPVDATHLGPQGAPQPRSEISLENLEKKLAELASLCLLIA